MARTWAGWGAFRCWRTSASQWGRAGYSSPGTSTLIKKKIKFSSHIRKFRREQLQSYIWLTASSYMVKYLRISPYTRKPFLISDFATDPIRISLFMRTISWRDEANAWEDRLLWGKVSEERLVGKREGITESGEEEMHVCEGSGGGKRGRKIVCVRRNA